MIKKYRKKASKKLKETLNRYCISKRKERRLWRRQYSTVCVGVENYEQNIQVCSYSYDHTYNKKYVFPECLKQKLSKLGTIGVTVLKGRRCVLGFCAEPHAAKELIEKLDRKGWNKRMGYLVFTKALKIRTGQVVDYCLFCKKTFKQLDTI